MRTFVILMAIYTLLLACIPCQDEVELHSDDNVTLVQQAAGHQDPLPDLCSPFCICACCAGITLQESIKHLAERPSAVLFSDNTFQYRSLSNSGDLSAIWQPPRI